MPDIAVLPILALSNAFVMGFRHGIDWDHVAAIIDIVGTTAIGKTDQEGAQAAVRKRTLGLSSLYALGHASAVLVLASIASVLCNVLPVACERSTEMLVGWTLILFGLWVAFSLYQYLRGQEDQILAGRWQLLFALSKRVVVWLHLDKKFPALKEKMSVISYGPRTAYGLGLLHGLGAETGSQVFVIAAIGGSNIVAGLGMLAAFVIGMVISNTIIALSALTGLCQAQRLKPFYVASAVSAGVFSIIIGTIFVLGKSGNLPGLF